MPLREIYTDRMLEDRGLEQTSHAHYKISQIMHSLDAPEYWISGSYSLRTLRGKALEVISLK